MTTEVALENTRDHLISIAGGFREASLLQQAVELGIFTACTAPRTAGSLAEDRGWSAEKVQILLDALTALKLLERVDGTYVISAQARPFLAPNSPASVTAMIMHERLQQPLWRNLKRTLQSADALPEQQDVLLREDHQREQLLLRAMEQMDAWIFEAVAALPVWSAACHVLDLAGGHGRFLAEIASRQPSIQGAVVDLPTAEASARATFRARRLDSRLGFIARDLEAPNAFNGLAGDAILIARAIHNFGRGEIRTIFEGCATTLPVGGQLVVVERWLDRDPPAPVDNLIFSAYMAVNCKSGWVPDRQWVHAELTRAGFDVEETRIGPLHVAYVAIKREVN